jgi:hypothetical protein
MKYFIPLIIFLSSCRSSTVFIRSNKVCTRTFENGQLSSPTDWKPTDTQIRIKDSNWDCVQSVLKIKGPVNLKLKLFRDGIDSKNENGVQSVRINAEDQDKNKCYVIFMKKEGKSYMTVYYTDMNLIYNVRGIWCVVPTERKVRFYMIWDLI